MAGDADRAGLGVAVLARAAKAVYRAVIPMPVRNVRWVAWLKSRLLPHDAIYDAEYYDTTVEGLAVRSARSIAETIVAEFHPRTVIDVGCGTGALLEALRDRGCEVLGLEYARAAITYCRSRGLEVVRFDLERDALEEGRVFDVAVSLEVAEHLPERIADRYVDLLTCASRVVIFTAAPPGQGGTDHVNEQPPEYWTAKFRARGLEHDRILSKRWRERWAAAGDVESWYVQNLMVFR